MSVDGRVLTPADDDQLFRIAKKIERMKAGRVADYVSKITGSTTDLSDFECSISNYTMEMEQREEEAGNVRKTRRSSSDSRRRTSSTARSWLIWGWSE